MVDPERSVSKLRQLAEHLVTLLDDRFRIPGTDFRFGLDPIIGILFPGIGDAVTGAGSVGLLALALRRGVPRVVLLRMLLNILVDVVAGSLPIVGDIFDAAYKSNRRNLELIREHEDSGSTPTAWDYAIATLGVILAILSIVVPLGAVFYFGINYGPELLEHLRRR
ncbi:MAG: DUF4112 domain-containing protein [Deltaproteobacteria bacterium]|nr:DUF4112 domain-containing protein [Deltaproteobacteria bacterium]MBW1874455.1 DUF4112 domain-containing protein [Deltaproteobacteria bacterium]MBW2209905.1 DUF4112 domain-containing protein [Deltaproteobacteria bacterium]MBW2213049.1 DUF4112 domain-containing protein [Deltaproteobacteria bacterium]MBW2378223.1 DUF4112 domain-containing protein [Deltaproteobacteria bacterium]